MKKLLLILFATFFIYGYDFNKVSNIYNKSYNYEKIGRYSEAIKVLIPLYKKYPRGYTLNLRLGWLYYLNRKFQNAIEHYKKAALIYPYSIEPRLGLANIYLTMQRYKDAQNMAYEVIKKDYYNYYGNLYAIKALIAQKKYQIAQELANKMLTLYPTNIDFLTQLAIIYKKSNNKNLKKLSQDILILDPNNIFIKNLNLK